MKRFALFIFLLIAPHVAYAQEPIIYVEKNADAIIEQGSEVQWPMASITKLMTALVLTDIRPAWRAVVSMNTQDEVGGARLAVAKEGGRYRRIDLLHASLIGSANNATHALARTSGVPLTAFVALMNEKAQTLGMTHTTFVDPTGMETGNVSTARDIARLIAAVEQQPLLKQIARKKSYSFASLAAKPKKHTVRNTNQLLMQDEPVILGKTGYLEDSRFNFVARIPSATGTVTVVILNAPTKNESFQLTRTFASMAP